MLLVELEIAYGERPFSFPNTYQAVRSSVEELNRAASLTELYDTAARAVRDLTGFDRVMVYRYDANYNGEVVAESKREDLNSFLGLHYPSTDIPAQARALYEKNWVRLISDVDYTPVPLVPSIDPASGTPLDLTYSTLRSVSPIHVEYLQNMGVHASMSISLLRRGRLWGLIACHHYAGPHLPPFGTRAAAEFLGSTLSLRLVDRFEGDQLHQRLAAQAVLAKLTAAIAGPRRTARGGAARGARPARPGARRRRRRRHPGREPGPRVGSAAGGRVRRRRVGARRGRRDREQRLPVRRATVARSRSAGGRGRPRDQPA